MSPFRARAQKTALIGQGYGLGKGTEMTVY